MERLSPMDAQFVDAEDEDGHASFAIASIAIFEGPAPTYEEFLHAIEGRLPLVPIYRRKLRTVPFRLGPPVWVEDPDFDLRYHVRHTALPAPGGDEQLRKLIARVMAQRLDRDYPLWEYWMIEGLQKGRWALISKVHHAMVDGVSGTDLYRVIFDLTPQSPPPLPSAGPRTVPAEPSAFALASQAAFDLMSLPAKAVRALTAAAERPAEALHHATEAAQAAVMLAAGSGRPAVASSLSGPIGRQRRYAWAKVSLDDIKDIKLALGGTVNDVVLAAISAGFRSLLLSRGERPEPHMVPSLIPVSLRAPGEENIYDNRVSVLIADLPVHIAEPAERLASVRTEMAALKAGNEAAAGEALIEIGKLAPYWLTSRVVRAAYRLPQHEIVTVTTNVPGPRQPIYGMGRRLVEIIPYVPIATTMRIGVSIFSYCDQVTFGITADYDSTPDIDVLARAIEKGIRELRKIARQRAAAANAA